MLYGRSIGTGPTIELAVRHPEIRAVVLQLRHYLGRES